MESLRYGHFDRVDTPIIAFFANGKIVYKNKAFLKFDPGFCKKEEVKASFLSESDPLFDNLRSPDKEVRKGGRRCRTVLFTCNGKSFPALVLRDSSPEGVFTVAVFAPFLQGNFTPSVFSDVPPAVPAFSGVAAIPEKKKLSHFAGAFIAPYAASIASTFEKQNADFRFEDACLFLNRFSERVLHPLGYKITARCTEDSMPLPLSGFSDLMAVFSCIALLFAEVSSNGETSVTLCCRKERPLFLFSYSPLTPALAKEAEKVCALDLLVPSRSAELRLLSAVLSELHYEEAVRFENGLVLAEFSGKDRLPTQYFKSRTEEEKMLVLSAIDALLSEYSDEEDYRNP